MKNISFVLLALAVCTVTSGCILGGMEERMDKTNNQMLETNDLLRMTLSTMNSVEKLSKLGAAIEIVTDDHKDRNDRVRKAQEMFVLADIDKEDQIWEQLGAFGPVKLDSLDATVELKTPDIDGVRQEPKKLALKVRNVSLVDARVAGSVEADRLELYGDAAKIMSRKLYGAVSNPAYGPADLREKTYQLIYVGTAVLGAAEGLDLARFDLPNADTNFYFSKREREDFANTLRSLHASLAMHDLISDETLDTLIVTRLGLE